MGISDRRSPSFTGGAVYPPSFRKGECDMITYSELFQLGILLLTLVSLCYQIFKGKHK